MRERGRENARGKKGERDRERGSGRGRERQGLGSTEREGARNEHTSEREHARAAI